MDENNRNEFETEEPTAVHPREAWSEQEQTWAEVGRRTRTLDRIPAMVLPVGE